jgi:hypothetical protein
MTTVGSVFDVIGKSGVVNGLTPSHQTWWDKMKASTIPINDINQPLSYEILSSLDARDSIYIPLEKFIKANSSKTLETMTVSDLLTLFSNVVPPSIHLPLIPPRPIRPSSSSSSPPAKRDGAYFQNLIDILQGTSSFPSSTRAHGSRHHTHTQMNRLLPIIDSYAIQTRRNISKTRRGVNDLITFIGDNSNSQALSLHAQVDLLNLLKSFIQTGLIDKKSTSPAIVACAFDVTTTLQSSTSYPQLVLS